MELGAYAFPLADHRTKIRTEKFMREHATRLVAFVVLLCVAAVVSRHWEPAIAAPQGEGTILVYMPFVPIQEPGTSDDLQIVHLGLYQSVQNQSNGVTLIANKPAMLRVYAQSTRVGGNPLVATITIEAERGGSNLGSLTVGPQAVSSEPSADTLGSTFNVELPSEWLEGEIVVTATIDKHEVIHEQDETNNIREAAFEFREVPGLDLTIVPITYIDSVTGQTFTEPGQDPISDWLLSAFPFSEINVDIHTPFTFTGNLRDGNEWSRLLSELTTLWAIEVGPGSPHIYYGLVPNQAPGGASWFNGGVSGLGWIGQRVSVGLNVGSATGVSAAHEIGHNLGRSHAPCGNPKSVDPHFPYPNASIGVYGVDTAGETLHDPERTHDVMSYCGPEWVSDYTYEGLFQDQLIRVNRMGVKGEGWLLQASINGDDIVALPALRVDQSFLQFDRAGKYQIRLLDSENNVIATYPAELFEAEEEGASARMLIAYIPDDGSEISATQFLSDGKIIATQTFEASLDSR